MTQVIEIEQVDQQHSEFIICPRCESVQNATVLHTQPWPSYVHFCACGYTIIESEWQRVELIKVDPQPVKVPPFLLPDSEMWEYGDRFFTFNWAMESHLFHDVDRDGGTDTKPVLIDGVWYWQKA